MLAVAVENLVEVVQTLEAAGTKIVTPPKQTAWGHIAIVRDPDGRAIELRQK